MKALAFFVLFFALQVSVSAQTEISGTVKDVNNASIAGANVQLQSKQSRSSAVSDANGAFRFTNVAGGDYKVIVAANGFAEQTIDVRVGGSDSEQLDIKLEVGTSEYVVTAELGSNVERDKIPLPINRIDSEEIAQRATSVLAQVGKEEAGVNVQSTSPTIGGIFVRGLAGKNVNVFVDGVRYSNSAQRGGINTFFNLNEPSNLQTVEILRGANSAQYGSDSLGGTVSLLTKSPVFTDVAELHGEFNPSFTSANRAFGSSLLLSYGTNKFGGYINLAARHNNTVRTADGLDSHAAITRFLGLPSNLLGSRLPDTAFTQYGGAFRLNYAPTETQNWIFTYQRSQQDGGKRYDQLLGGDGNLIADLRNLMLDFGYIRYLKQNFGFFDDASFTVSYNSQREERVNQGGQGNPLATVTHQYERTTATGFSFFLDKNYRRTNLLIGGDYYFEKINSPAFTFNPANNSVVISRPRIPDEARFINTGVFVQNSWELFKDRLRLSGALRYGGASYRARQSDSPVVGGSPLWRDDSLRVADFSGRVGAVLRVVDEFRIAFNFSRGFRYPSMTDLGTLGLTGDGFEVDYVSAVNLGGRIGTTADANAISTGLPVTKQLSETSNNFDFSFRYQKKHFDTDFTVFYLTINDSITKQALILPQGSVGRFLGDQPIVSQNANGVVFVPLSTTPVLVRSNYTTAQLFGFEYELETKLSRDFDFRGNFTYIRSADSVTDLPPNIEGGTPPPTGFLSVRYAPAGKRYWIEAYSTLAARQDRLSSLDLADRRTGATRSRAQITNYFRRGACVQGLTNNPDGRCGTGDETILLPTGETLAQVQNRVLGTANSAPLFSYLPGYGLVNLRGSFRIGEHSQIFAAFENILDQRYRNPSWGMDGAGRSFTIQWRYKF